MTWNATQPQVRKYVKEQRRDVEGKSFIPVPIEKEFQKEK